MKGQINVFLVLGILIVMIFGTVIYATNRISEKKADIAFERITLSPGELSPIRTYAENLLYTVSEEALFKIIGAGADVGVVHDPLPNLAAMKILLVNDIDANFTDGLDLSQFASDGILISQSQEEEYDISINPDDVVVILKNPWTLKTSNIQSTINEFKTILFVRLGLVYDISEYVSSKIANSEPIDCGYISAIGGIDGEGNPYISVSVVPNLIDSNSLITITDAYTEKFYFQKPFVFKFRVNEEVTESCPVPP